MFLGVWGNIELLNENTCINKGVVALDIEGALLYEMYTKVRGDIVTSIMSPGAVKEA